MRAVSGRCLTVGSTRRRCSKEPAMSEALTPNDESRAAYPRGALLRPALCEFSHGAATVRERPPGTFRATATSERAVTGVRKRMVASYRGSRISEPASRFNRSVKSRSTNESDT